MGDNGRRARAYPRIEGDCPFCKRFMVILKNGKLPRHRCDESFKHGMKPVLTYNPVYDQRGH